MLKTLFCFLRNGLFQACIFGHALLLAICKILLLPPSGIYTRSQALHRGVWVSIRSVGDTYGSAWGISRQSIPSGSRAGLLIESLMWLGRSTTTLYVVFWALAAVLPTTYAPRNATQYYGCDKRKISLLGSDWQSWGSQVLAHFPLQEKSQAKKRLSWYRAVPPWGRCSLD